MWCCLPFFQNDSSTLRELLSWLKQLDDHIPHGALLVADADVDWADASDLVALASKVFRRTEIISTDISVGGWPYGANSLFKCAAQHFEKRNIGPWMFNEPDCIPHKKGWLDKIEAGYHAANKPFMGAVMEAKESNMPQFYMAGCGVYPMDTWKRLSVAWREDVAFDIATAPVVVPQAANTPLIQHFWGQKNLPPTFVSERRPDSPVNAFTLDKLNPDSVVFHRNKDGTLIRQLGYLEPQSASLDVVASCHSDDCELLKKNLEWQSALCGKRPSALILLVDHSVVPEKRRLVVNMANAAYSEVVVKLYSSPRRGWPNGPNRAFKEAVIYMQGRSGTAGWVWFEPDAVPIGKDWLEAISWEYARSGKAFMGTVIDHMGHMNGVGVYPKNMGRYVGDIDQCGYAWDVCIDQSIRPFRHRANHLIQHHLSPPSFNSKTDLVVIPPGVRLFHPDKGGRLISLLSRDY